MLLQGPSRCLVELDSLFGQFGGNQIFIPIAPTTDNSGLYIAEFLRNLLLPTQAFLDSKHRVVMLSQDAGQGKSYKAERCSHPAHHGVLQDQEAFFNPP